MDIRSLIELQSYNIRGLTFDVRQAGTEDGEPVMLLHGFPETSMMWEALMADLAGSGLRCVAPDQRGYSQGARPKDIMAYRGEELVADVVALADALGWAKFHLVAHDWGAVVGWQLVQKEPSRVASYCALSIPHYRAFAEATWEDDANAAYRGFLELVVAQEGAVEGIFAQNDMAELRSTWVGDTRLIDHYVAVFSQPSALRSMLAWYRASDGHRAVLRNPPSATEYISTPTILIWGRNDPYVGHGAIDRASRFMAGPYDVLELDAGHWLAQEAGPQLRDAVMSHISRHIMRLA